MKISGFLAQTCLTYTNDKSKTEGHRKFVLVVYFQQITYKILIFLDSELPDKKYRKSEKFEILNVVANELKFDTQVSVN